MGSFGKYTDKRVSTGKILSSNEKKHKFELIKQIASAEEDISQVLKYTTGVKKVNNSISQPNEEYKLYLREIIENKVLDKQGEIYTFQNKDDFAKFMETNSIKFQAKYGIKLDIFEELTKNAFNYGANNNPIAFSIKSVEDNYEFSVYNLGKSKNIPQVAFNLFVAKNKAKLANNITVYEAKLLQLINMNLGNQDAKTIKLLGKNGSDKLKFEKIKELATEILDKHNSLAARLSKENGIDKTDIDALATRFAEDVQEYGFKRENTDTKDGIGNGIMYVREKTGGNIDYEIKKITADNAIVFIAKVLVNKETLDKKAEKFRTKMGIE